MKIYLMLLMFLLSTTSRAASKCLTEIGSFCPSNVEQIECLRTNFAKFSPKCTEAIKIMIAGAEPATKSMCEADIQKFCASDKDDLKKLPSCLNANLKLLSPECQKSGEFVIEKIKETAVEAKVNPAESLNSANQATPTAPHPSAPQKDRPPIDPCENDLKTLCPDMKSSEQLKCMQTQMDKLNPECASMLNNMTNMKSNFDKAKAACKLDAEKFCPSETGDREKKAACMKANEANLSAECKSTGGWVE